jgi:hypothetical protein
MGLIGWWVILPRDAVAAPPLLGNMSLELAMAIAIAIVECTRGADDETAPGSGSLLL